jgi:ubiquinone/menaquinone biosynthesis C-methylase UbiE
MSDSESDYASLYHDFSSIQFKLAFILMEEVLKPQTGESILDLGCGTGKPAMVLASRVGPSGRIVGVDPDEARVEVAQKTVAESEVKHVSFKHGVCSDAISDGPFDAVFCSFVLHWIRDPGPVFEDAYKCLRSGGRFVFLVPSVCPKVVRAMLKELVGSEDINAVLGRNYSNFDYWNKLCTEAGFFTVELIEEKVVQHTFPDPMSIMNVFRSTASSSVALPCPKKEEVIQWLKPFTDETTGEVHVNQPVVRVVMRKP